MTLVSTDWLNQNLNKVKIIDASWHLDKNRNAIKEYNEHHIENAIFFDLDKNSNKFPWVCSPSSGGVSGLRITDLENRKGLLI